jgi:AsmA protein
MPRSLKYILFIIGGAVGLLVLVALAVSLFVDVNRYKPRLEAAASNALGMDVRIGGRLGMGLFPGLHVTAEDGRILGEQGETVASVKRASLWIDLLPLLHGELRLRRVELLQPLLAIERDPEGRINVEGLKKATVLLGLLDGVSVSLSGGTLRYGDGSSRDAIEATGLDLNVTRMRFAGGRSPRRWQDLSLKAELTCGEIRGRDFSMSALKVSVDGKDGILELMPVTMRLFDAQMTGGIQADLSGPVPHYQIRCALPRFRIEEFLRTLSPKKAVEGTMSFSTSLSMQGRSLSEMVQTAAGEVSLRGENLVLEGHDLDRTLARFKSSQNFNLVDVGAIFFAGPFGLAVTKGYNFASLFEGSGGTSRIHTLVSEWRVERGVAKARDVALATSRNRIALQGGLDFVTGRFADVTVAVVDAKGCATVRQAMRGPFGKPVVEKPQVLTSLAGPMIRLYERTRGLFPARPCEAFYSGSVAPPG